MISGDIIEVKVDNIPLIKHYGIIIVKKGNVYVLHNTPILGKPTITSYSNFLNSRYNPIIIKSSLSGKNEDFIRKKFLKLNQSPFDIISNNCEHFIDEMLGNNKHSEQLSKYIIFILLIVFLYSGTKIYNK